VLPTLDLRGNTRPIAVERQRLAVSTKILTRGFEISKCGLRACEQDLHKPTCRVVERRARRSPFFKPVMLTAVEVHELANARPTNYQLLKAAAASSESKARWRPVAA
jgi:hypothetical protein